MLKFLSSLILFGTNGIVAAQISLPSYEIVVLRTLLGSLLLGGIFLFCRKRSNRPSSRRGLALIILSGACLGISWMFLFDAYIQIGVGTSTLIYYCAPVVVMALSPLLFKERLTRAALVGFAFVLVGIVVVNGTGGQDGLSGQGIASAALSALFFVAMVVFSKKAEGVDGLKRSLVQIVAAFVVSAVATGLLHGFSMQVQPADVIPILVLGLVNTGLGSYLYFSSLGALKAQTIAVCGYLEPVSAVVMASLFLGEVMSPLQVLGAVMVLAGATFGELAPQLSRRMHRHPVQAPVH